MRKYYGRMKDYKFHKVLRGFMVTTMQGTAVALYEYDGTSHSGWNGNTFTHHEKKYLTLNDFLAVYGLEKLGNYIPKRK